MESKIAEYIKSRGYGELRASSGQVRAFFRIDGALVMVVVMMDGHSFIISSERYVALREQIRGIFLDKGYSNIHILALLFVSNPESARSVVSGEENAWIVDDRHSRLVVYEDQLADFDGFREGFEDIILKNRPSGGSLSNVTSWLGDRLWRSDTPITVSLVLLNVIVFVALSMEGSTEDSAFMIDHGAIYAPYVLNNHQYYRLFTAMFLHFGIEHLGANMLSLWLFGERVEKELGKIDFILVYLISGFIGGCFSMLMSMITGVMATAAGASGAIFGIIGALFAIVIKNHGVFKSMTTSRIALLIGYSIFAGMTGQGIDNAAHIGGLIGGLIVGMLLYSPVRRKRRAGGEA